MGKTTFRSLLYGQWTSLPPVTQADVAGKTIMVIGANTGLGFEAAKHMARMEPGKLILGCRDSEKSRNALTKIKEETGNEDVELWYIDLASFDSVKAFVDKFEKQETRLDILLENASTTSMSSFHTDDGWESTLQVNCLSIALLAILLLPHLIKTAKAFNTTTRLPIVSSMTHMSSKLDQELVHSGHFWKTFGSKEYVDRKVLQTRYEDTKLLQMYFVRSLTDHLGHSPTSPIVNAVCPGICYSELRRGWASFFGILGYIQMRLLEMFLARTTEVGSRTLVHGALGGVGNEDQWRGGYFSGCEITEAGDNVVSLEGKRARGAIWSELITILEEIDPRVKRVVADHLSLAR